MVTGNNIDGVLKPKLAFKFENEDIILLTRILNILTHILCKAVEYINGGELLTEGKIASGKLRFNVCDTLLNGSGTPSTACLPVVGIMKDVIETRAVEGLLKLHLIVSGGAVEPLIYIKPTAVGPLAVVSSSEECAVGQNINIEGELVLKDLTAAAEGGPGGLKQEAIIHLVEESSLSTLKASGQTATIDGTAEVKLTGALHEGRKWSGLPSATKP